MEEFIQNIPYIENIEILFYIFMIYSIAGWIMESVGGIFTVKKFVNRGFMIGPYCPVYGVGVVIITVLLKKYTNDFPVLFILSTLICGTLEYFTSYIMEKLFNARWWDYHNKKFNINGRICLETLLPFGIVGSLILCIINPFLVELFYLVPMSVSFIVFVVLLCLFIIDFIVSFKIISGFKGQIKNTSKDLTEEISGKVKDKTEEISKVIIDKTEDTLMRAESNIILFGRKLKLSKLKFDNKVRFTRKYLNSFSNMTLKGLSNTINYKKKEFENKISLTKEKIILETKNRKEQIYQKNVERKNIIEDKIENSINTIKNSSNEFTARVKESFSKKSKLTSRLMKAFPDMQIRLNVKNKKENEENSKK